VKSRNRCCGRYPRVTGDKSAAANGSITLMGFAPLDTVRRLRSEVDATRPRTVDPANSYPRWAMFGVPNGYTLSA
jgi:hypothetical protein